MRRGQRQRAGGSERTEEKRRDELAEDETGSDGDLKNERKEGAAGTQLMAPQSLRLPPLCWEVRGAAPTPSTPLSPSPFLARSGCYVIKLKEKQGVFIHLL